MQNFHSFIFGLSLVLLFACNSGNTSTSAKVETETATSTEPIAVPVAEKNIQENVQEIAEASVATLSPETENTTEQPSSSSKVDLPKAKEEKAAPKQSEPTKVKPEPTSTPELAPALAPQTKMEEVKKVKEEVKKVAPAAEVPAPKVKETKPALPALTHAAWDQILRKHVSATGKVNYKGIKADQKQLDAYLAVLAANPIQADWSRNKKMAYWINAYNAFTIKLIVKNYPVAKITNLHGGKPWDQKWIKLGDKTYSLNDIENNILRPQFNDARIHFAVNCAAKSCPPILNRAWTADNLNANFEKQTKAFINGSDNQIREKEVKLSKIFEWYKGDFGDLIAFLNKYSTTTIKPNAKISFLEYNWDLNE